LNTFFLEVSEADLMNRVDFELDKKFGYIIVYQETMNIGSIIMRICKSFQAEVYQTSVTSCERDFQQSQDQL
jgi:hypothetical protein